MGGHRNIFTLLLGIRHAFEILGLDPNALPKQYFFPTIGEYSGILEAAGFEVRQALLFDRPTPLAGESEGLRNWVRQFNTAAVALVPTGRHDKFFQLVEEYARPTLASDNGWIADYRRLRVTALAV